jgi:predicted signal transduction protein with EAL and GGDEF domain
MLARTSSCRVLLKSVHHTIAVNHTHPLMHSQLDALLSTQGLRAHFQPILGLRKQAYVGYEALIRGPSDSTLHAPTHRFQHARGTGPPQGGRAARDGNHAGRVRQTQTARQAVS